MKDIKIFEKFRQKLYELFPKSRDATMDLIDALSSDLRSTSVIQLSLSPYFRRKYASVTQAIGNFFRKDKRVEENGHYKKVTIPCEESQEQLQELLASHCCPRKDGSFVFGADTTPALRPYAETLADRGITYCPTNTPGNKPIGVGHCYSLLAYLPEKSAPLPWILPLDVRRVPTAQKGHELGFEQLGELLNRPNTPFYKALCLLVTDSLYPVINNREVASAYENLVWIFRVRSNRNFYAPPSEEGSKKKYGHKMKLNKPETHLPPNHQGKFIQTTSSGQKRLIHYKRWNGLLLRGSRKFKGYLHPLDLVQYEVFDLEGNRIFQRPLWLAIEGKRRNEISPERTYENYGQRFDLEHFFRFGKNNLLMDQFQTPDVEHEESWWKIAQLAYVQLFLARNFAKATPYPWEKYLKSFNRKNQASPSQVQRDFTNILDQLGTPAKPVQPCKPGKGRKLGESQPKRTKADIQFKTKKKKENNHPRSTENKEDRTLLGVQEWGQNLKTPKLDDLVLAVREKITELGFNQEDFVEKLRVIAPH